MKKPIIMVAVLLAATLVFSGCFLTDWATKKASEQITEGIAEQATNGEVDIDYGEGTVTVETEEGTMSMGQDDIPEDFPSNVPVYADATVVWTSSSTADQTYWVDLESADEFTAVEAFYEDELPAQGWEVTDKTSYTADGQATTIFYANDGVNDLVVTVSSSDNKVMISLNAMAKQE